MKTRSSVLHGVTAALATAVLTAAVPAQPTAGPLSKVMPIVVISNKAACTRGGTPGFRVSVAPRRSSTAS